jgi:RNA 2',3'-cyclic 3'-phosphodiesterase
MARRGPKFVKDRPPDQTAVESDWRLFIAIPLPERIQEQVARYSATLSSHDWPVRWVGADSAHLTLHFVGDTPPERGELLRMGLPIAVAKLALGVFPHFGQPRVLWLGLTGETERLIALQAEIGRQLAKLDFEVDMRPPHPRITLGRVRDNPPANLGAQVQAAYADPAFAAMNADADGTFTVSEVHLVRSFIERGGARHEIVTRCRLAQPNS